MSNEKSCCCSASSCCSTKSITPYDINDKWVTGEIHTPKGSVPVVSSNLHFKDILGAWAVIVQVVRNAAEMESDGYE